MFNIFKKAKVNESTQQIKFKISGMHCASCSLNIDGELEDLDGVISANTSYAKSQVKVEFDEEKISPKKIKQVVKKLGYEIQ